MMLRRHHPGPLLRALLSLLPFLLSVSCASTKLASKWRDPSFQGGPFKKIAIFAVAKQETARRSTEDLAVQEMPAGTQGVASHTLFADPDKDEEKVKERLSKDGFDGTLVFRVASVEKTQTYVPPHYNARGSFYGYYGEAYNYYSTAPGYMKEDTTVIVEALFYNLPEMKLVWSGVSESLNPKSTDRLVQDVVRLTEEELKVEGLIGTPAGEKK